MTHTYCGEIKLQSSVYILYLNTQSSQMSFQTVSLASIVQAALCTTTNYDFISLLSDIADKNDHHEWEDVEIAIKKDSLGQAWLNLVSGLQVQWGQQIIF